MDVSATFQWWLWGFKGWFNDVAIWFLLDTYTYTCSNTCNILYVFWYIISDTCYHIIALWYLLSDTCYLIFAIWYYQSDIYCLILAIKYLLSDTCIKYLIIDTCYLILSVRHRFYSLLSMWHLFNKISHYLPKSIVYFTHVLCLMILCVSVGGGRYAVSSPLRRHSQTFRMIRVHSNAKDSQPIINGFELQYLYFWSSTEVDYLQVWMDDVSVVKTWQLYLTVNAIHEILRKSQ